MAGLAAVADGRLAVSESREPKFVPNLPPGYRDFLVYQWLAVEGQSFAEVSSYLSQPRERVRAIRDRVLEWIASEVPPADHLTSAQRLAAAQQLAVDRLEFLYETVIAAWHASKGDTSTEYRQVTPVGEQSITTRYDNGRVCYIHQAMRIAKELAKFPQRRLAMPFDGEEAIPEVRPKANTTRTDVSAASISPPKEDCSARLGLAEAEAQREAEAEAIIRDLERTYLHVANATEEPAEVCASANGACSKGKNGVGDGGREFDRVAVEEGAAPVVSKAPPR